jgi:hypothetical protein
MQGEEIDQEQDQRVKRLTGQPSIIDNQANEDLETYQHRLISAISHKLHYVDDLIKSNNQTSLANESENNLAGNRLNTTLAALAEHQKEQLTLQQKLKNDLQSIENFEKNLIKESNSILQKLTTRAVLQSIIKDTNIIADKILTAWEKFMNSHLNVKYH